MKIVKLDIDENSVLSGIDAVALVEQPAIEEDFMYFSQESFAETFTDYPQSVVDAAKQGIKRNLENNNKCATQVGKVRAQQLAQGKPISKETIKRMFSYLSRAEVYYEKGDTESCGYISYLLWGGNLASTNHSWICLAGLNFFSLSFWFSMTNFLVLTAK